ncbi:hypothetical protein CTAYLR_006495 [Chrysophaeum taylorii]|uniref:Orotidine 5'-phosphate decarboxylase n=1 Tax=Chrysophaeum taylorii TaxID=2483200 RepID=A0AAD7ULD2_9STRA|nr:hypothetical protein CTAYLR_006495 [Chrysophaeum taylorii]
MGFFARVQERGEALDSWVCVGLDPRAASAAEAEAMCLEIIEATAPYACCFKPNAAFFEVHGGEGIKVLGRVIAAAHARGAPVILDAKRGDVGSTATMYAKAAFETLDADAATLSPYLGWDAVEPFAHYPGKGLFVLCATSNPSGVEVQRGLRRDVARWCASDGAWGTKTGGSIGLVVGATDVAALDLVRAVNRDSWILAPGVGAQGGDLDAAVRAARTRVIVPASRAVSDAPDRASAACALRDRINAALRFPVPRPLAPHQTAFLTCVLASGALRFGDFELKSGRRSPYFFNAGLIFDGDHVAALFDAYADRILLEPNLDFDVIFGPAYKGIPLCAGVAAALARKGRRVAFAYNRKELKDHGEGGTLVGAPLEHRNVLLIDDVISAGTAIREASTLLAARGARLVAVCVALDRQEVTGGPDLPPPDQPRVSAVDAARRDINAPVFSILTLADLLQFLEDRQHHQDGDTIQAVRKYRDDYGIILKLPTAA